MDEKDGAIKLDEKVKDILEWILWIIITASVLLTLKYFVGTQTIVKQASMYPTLKQDQRLWLNRWGRTIKKLPEKGDIITFQEPDKVFYTLEEIDPNNPVAYYEERTGFEWFKYNFLEIGKRSYIKRVIATPNQHVKIENGKVYIDGEELEESYLQEGVVTEVLGAGFSEFIVPENCVFAMGDNRTKSTDCRAFGCIPLDKIESKVFIRIWPLDVFGKIDK